MQVQNNEYIKIYGPSDLTLRLIIAGPNCTTLRLRILTGKKHPKIKKCEY